MLGESEAALQEVKGYSLDDDSGPALNDQRAEKTA
jgi:hypothetical protein